MECLFENSKEMENRKKIAVIGTVGLPANYGGFETLAERLVEHLGERFDFSVYCSGKKYAPEKRNKTYKGARLIYLPLEANGIQSILYDCISIIHALFYADVLLILGVSGGFMLPFVKLFTRKKIIISIDGIEWKRNKWNLPARLYLWVAEWMAVKFSHADIADNESIQDYTAVRYKTLSNIIEYGADHTIKVMPTEEDREKYPFLKFPYAFKVCRIEPENNIGMVLEAFSTLTNYKLVMVGNWNNSAYGKEMRAKYEGFANIIMLDPIYDQRELDVIRGNCLLYVHGHSAGGTNPSLVEAMYLGLPVMAFGVSYNRATTEGKALYFDSEEALRCLVVGQKICDLKKIGNTMYEIAHRRYTWKLVADKYAFLITQALLSGEKRPLYPTVSGHIPARVLVKYELAHLQVPEFFYEKR